MHYRLQENWFHGSDAPSDIGSMVVMSNQGYPCRFGWIGLGDKGLYMEKSALQQGIWL